jgi:hypothetical protein
MRTTRRPRDTPRDQQLTSTDLGAGDPPGATRTWTPKAWQERAHALDAERTAFLNVMEQQARSMGGILALSRAASKGDVVENDTLQIPAPGVVQRQFSAGYKAVSVFNSSSGALTVTGSPAQSQAPTVGAGVFVVPAFTWRTVPISGAVLSVYGAIGTTFDIVVYSRPRDINAGQMGNPPGQVAQILTPANPAAGADISITPSASSSFQILTVAAQLATSATVGNRAPSLRFTTPGAGTPAVVAPDGTVTVASSQTTYQWWPGSGYDDTGAGYSTTPIPPGIWLPAGTVISTLTNGIVAGDQWQAIVVSYLLNNA